MFAAGSRRTRGTVQAFDELFTHSTIKAISYLYSQTETGLRHPHGPVGIVLRDQGQADLYAGKSRVLLTVEGVILSLARTWAVMAQEINMRAASLADFHVQGRTFNQAVFEGQTLAGIRDNIPPNLGLITSELRIEPRTGKIVSGFVPFTDVFVPHTVFDPPTANESNQKRQYDLWMMSMGIKRAT